MLSFARGLSVIRAFGDGRGQLTASDAARLTGLSRASARRCLHTLQVLGYAKAEKGAYELTTAVLSLGYAYLGSTVLVRAAQPVLERVANQLHESSSMALLDRDEVVYVARVATRRIISIGLSVGSRLPAACTSMGRVLLAFMDAPSRARYLSSVELVAHTPRTITSRSALRLKLDEVRSLGYAIVDQELEMGLRSIAVPIRSQDGHVVAAINVGVQAGRADARTLQREFWPVLRQAAKDITSALGRGPLTTR